MITSTTPTTDYQNFFKHSAHPANAEQYFRELLDKR